MSYLYALELQHNKYYIGRTNNVDKRVNDHLLGYGAEWTRHYRVIRLIEYAFNNDPFDEDKYVKKYMNKYGIDNVRGGSYVTLYLSENQKKCISDELKTANNLCYKCGGADHYISSCTN